MTGLAVKTDDDETDDETGLAAPRESGPARPTATDPAPADRDAARPTGSARDGRAMAPPAARPGRWFVVGK